MIFKELDDFSTIMDLTWVNVMIISSCLNESVIIFLVVYTLSEEASFYFWWTSDEK